MNKNDPLQKLKISDDDWLGKQANRLGELLIERNNITQLIEKLEEDILKTIRPKKV